MALGPLEKTQRKEDPQQVLMMLSEGPFLDTWLLLDSWSDLDLRTGSWAVTIVINQALITHGDLFIIRIE